MIDVGIIGAGPAGLTAALYAKRYGLSVIVWESTVYGGQVATTPEIENYPAIAKISGFDFSNQLHEQTKALGVEVKMENVQSVSLSSKEKQVITESGCYDVKTLIIANGTKRRKLGCEGEDVFTGKGVSYCATCDGAFFRGKTVAIVGGGNTALEDALFLSRNCSKVYLIHRRDIFRGMRVLESAAKSTPNIEVLYSSTIKSILGDKKVTGITIESKDSGVYNKDVSAVFIAVGTEPDNGLFKSELILDSQGYLIAEEDTKTNIDGVYVAGDSRVKPLRQIVTATSDGAVAAFMAANYINIQWE